jgi:predicted DNA binding CopG/RHH family protein
VGRGKSSVLPKNFKDKVGQSRTYRFHILSEEEKMKNTNITFKLSEAEKEAIKAAAAKKDIPMSQFIREAIKEYIQKDGA